MKKAVFVLGMHRSGTSAMAGVLNKLGCTSGKDDELLSADTNNSLGYFERKDIVSCNEKILRKYFLDEFKDRVINKCFKDDSVLDNYGWMFGAWSSLVEPNNVPEDELQCVSDSIKELVSSDNGAKLAYIVKDPRISITYPFWEKALNEKPLIIIMVRNPMHVAESLYKRDNIPVDVSMALWESYTKSAFERSERNSRIIVSYDSLVDDTAGVIDKLSLFLKENGVDVDEFKAEAISHVDSMLRHTNKTESFSKSSNALNAYRKIIANDFNANLDLKYARDVDLMGWEKILFVPSIAFRQKVQVENVEAVAKVSAKITRLLNHPITGPVIKFVRFLKKDKTFG